MIRGARIEDAEALCRIYNYYVENTIITFEEIPVTVDDMKNRILKGLEHFPWLVYESQGSVIGYAYAGKWRVRSAYRYTVETTIYLDKQCHGQKIGTQLYKHLIEELVNRNIHRVVACIALPNDASVQLHEKLGFKKVARFTEVGYKFNQWLDIGYWQLNV